MSKRVTVKEIVVNPLTVEIPTQTVDRYLLGKELVEAMDASNAMAITDFILREGFSREYSIMVMIEASIRDQTICDTPAFLKWSLSMDM